LLKSESIKVFDSQGEAYKRAFQIFLDHTDQKRNAKRFLQKLIDGLPNRTVFIDAGAGNGEMTKAFADAFRHTIAVEPNPHLLIQLKQAIPQAEAIGVPILAADPKAHYPATNPPGCRRLFDQTLPDRRHLSALCAPGFSTDTGTGT
jgi:hypothetical protein